MKQEFIPYQQALVHKGLGFDEPCFGWYSNMEGNVLRQGYCETYLGIENCTKAPLHQQAFRWFRQKYDISYSIDWMTRKIEYYSGYIVHFRGINGHKLNEDNFVVLNDELPPEGYGVYKTYEEAEQACLKKLIEIVEKQKKDESKITV